MQLLCLLSVASIYVKNNITPGVELRELRTVSVHLLFFASLVKTSRSLGLSSHYFISLGTKVEIFSDIFRCNVL